MSYKIEKIKDLEYNELITINVIEGDKDLLELFSDSVSISINLVKVFSTKGELTDKIIKVIKSIFNDIILSDETYIARYIYLAKESNITIKDNTIKTEPEVEKPEVKVVEPKPIEAVKKVKIPRRYGINLIKADIANNGGKPTPLQSAMLSLHELTNISVNLNTKSIKDRFTDSKYISDEDAKMIVTMVAIIKQKTKHILKNR